MTDMEIGCDMVCTSSKKQTSGNENAQFAQFAQFADSHHTASATCAASIAGTPYLNFLCWVLWRQTFIPNHAPTLPPKAANPSNTLSGMRQRLCCAFHLSMPYTMKVTTVMAAK